MASYSEMRGKEFLELLDGELSRHQRRMLSDNPDYPSTQNRDALSRLLGNFSEDSLSEKSRDIRDTRGYPGTNEDRNAKVQFRDIPSITIDEALNGASYDEFRAALGGNPALQSRFLDAAQSPDPDFDALKVRWIATVDYFGRFNTLNGADKLFDVAPDAMDSAVYLGAVKPGSPSHLPRDLAGADDQSLRRYFENNMGIREFSPGHRSSQDSYVRPDGKIIQGTPVTPSQPPSHLPRDPANGVYGVPKIEVPSTESPVSPTNVPDLSSHDLIAQVTPPSGPKPA